jgi:hypothetical protein
MKRIWLEFRLFGVCMNRCSDSVTGDGREIQINVSTSHSVECFPGAGSGTVIYDAYYRWVDPFCVLRWIDFLSIIYEFCLSPQLCAELARCFCLRHAIWPIAGDWIGECSGHFHTQVVPTHWWSCTSNAAVNVNSTCKIVPVGHRTGVIFYSSCEVPHGSDW